MIKVNVTMDKAKVSRDIEKASEYAMEVGAQEMLKYANDYVRLDSGALKESSIRDSDFKKGELKWTTEYARKMYYIGTPSKDRNPKASLRWAHKAKKLHAKDVEKVMQKALESKL